VNIAAPASPLGVSVRDVRIVDLPGARWRVLGRRDELLGHIEAVDGAGARRFRGVRYVARQRGFRGVGEFAAASDAVDAVRFG
jgi:hypothetical protein